MLFGDYFNSLNFYKRGELFRKQIGKSGVQVNKENERFTAVRSRSPQNLECGHFTLLFYRGQQRNASKCKTHVQCLFLLIKPVFLRRCRCHRRHRCLSSHYGFKTLADACEIVDRLLPSLQTPETVMHGQLAIDFTPYDLIPTEL